MIEQIKKEYEDNSTDENKIRYLLARAWALNSLENYNIREFVSCVKIKKMTEDEYDTLVQEMRNPTEENHWGINRTRKGGRESNKTFLLHPDQKLAKTYCIQMLSKQKIAIMAGGKPPTYPVYTVEGNIPPPLQLKHIYMVVDNLIDSQLNSKCIVEYPDSTLSQLLEEKVIIIYIGLTFRTLQLEGLRWLTERGANQMHLDLTEKQTARNRPVLIDQNNETITMGNARERGFKSKYLYLTFVYAYLYNIFIVSLIQALYCTRQQYISTRAR